MWQPSMAPMMSLWPQMRSKAAADDAFSQAFGQEMNVRPIVQMVSSTSRTILWADDWETSNLSDISLKLFWLAMYHRNISNFLCKGTGATPCVCSLLMFLSCSCVRRNVNCALFSLKWRAKVKLSLSSMTSHWIPVFRMTWFPASSAGSKKILKNKEGVITHSQKQRKKKEKCIQYM